MKLPRIFFTALLFFAGSFVHAQADSITIEKRLALLGPEEKFTLLDSLSWYMAGQDAPRAISYFKREIQFVEDNGLKQKQGKINTTRAHIHRKTGNLPKAEEEIKTAISVCRATNDTDNLYNACLEAGNIFYQEGDYANSIKYFVEAQACAIQLNKKPAQASCSNNIANIYYNQGFYQKALANYETARSVYAAIGNKVYAALALDNIANCYYKMNSIDTAMQYHITAYKEIEAAGDSSSLAEVAINIAVVFIDNNDPAKGLPFLERALQLSRSQGYKGGEVIVQLNFSEAYMNLGELDKAMTAAEEAAAIAGAAGMNEYLQSAFEQMALISEKQGKPAEALSYWKKYMALKDTLFSSEKQELMSEMSAKYEVDKKDSEISELNQEKERKQQQLYYLAGGLALVLLFSILLIRVNGARRKANQLLGEQNKIIAEKNKDITDSITYASRIQQSVLPDEQILRESVNDYFILNRPRDIVSGDFFWLAKKDGRIYIAVADCTGHGVPGALVSVIGINMLNKAIEMPGTPSTSEMLERLHRLVAQALSKGVGTRGAQDGMDIALLCIDKQKSKAWFSGAARPLYYSVNGKFDSIRGDRFSIAGEKQEGTDPYAQHEIALEGDVKFYLSSDGYADQFGEASGKKFLSKRFQELLASVSALPMEEQKTKVENAFSEWKGKLEQVDDVLVIGVSA